MSPCLCDASEARIEQPRVSKPLSEVRCVWSWRDERSHPPRVAERIINSTKEARLDASACGLAKIEGQKPLWGNKSLPDTPPPGVQRAALTPLRRRLSALGCNELPVLGHSQHTRTALTL
jgi:hypothetical protein